MAEATAPGGNPPPVPTLAEARAAATSLDSVLGGNGSAVNDQNRPQVQSAIDVINRFQRGANPADNAQLAETVRGFGQERNSNVNRALQSARGLNTGQDQGWAAGLGDFLNSDIGKLLAGIMSMLGVNMEGMQNQFPGAPAAPAAPGASTAPLFSPGGPAIAGVVTAKVGDTQLNTSINNGAITAYNVDGTPVAAGTQVAVTQNFGNGQVQITQMVARENGLLAPAQQTPAGALPANTGQIR